MSSRKARVDRLLRIIELCQAIKEKKFDPFKVEVKDILNMLREYLPAWKTLEEYGLDMEALRGLAEIIKLQGDWIKHMASTLYVDLLLLTLKIKASSIKSLAYALLRSWYPIVAIDSISPEKLRAAIEYWNQLLPMEERYRRLVLEAAPMEYVMLTDLFRLEFLSRERFNSLLRSFWEELLEKVGKNKKVAYRDFVYASTFEDTVIRAYLTSFLLTYGYATLETDPITGDIFLIPFKEPRVLKREQTFSVSIPINYALWRNYMEKQV